MASTHKYRSLRGMPDTLAEEASVIYWLESKAREVFRLFGYGEIRTPILEETEVFTRSIGEDTDIVEKEMYSFTDRGGKNISLRPEGTAPIIRAYIEHGWHSKEDLTKLFYTGAMFRGERPQKGRLRQFHQIGAEIIGGSDPYIDAELILGLDTLLKSLKVDGFTILLNSLGCASDRENYKEELASYLKKKSSALCDNCKRRKETNVLRVLDCKREGCKAVVKGAPEIQNYLCKGCCEYYDGVKSILKKMGITFREKGDLVRGLDYYTGTIFEVIHPQLGAQDAIAAGGRYDELTKDMGGPSVGATGYAIGIERLLLAVDKKDIPREGPLTLVIPVGAGARAESFKAADTLRRLGVPCEMDYSGRSLKGGMRKAHKEGRKFIVILGEDEIKSGKLSVKDMETGEEKALSPEEAASYIKGT